MTPDIEPYLVVVLDSKDNNYYLTVLDSKGKLQEFSFHSLQALETKAKPFMRKTYSVQPVGTLDQARRFGDQMSEPTPIPVEDFDFISGPRRSVMAAHIVADLYRAIDNFPAKKAFLLNPKPGSKNLTGFGVPPLVPKGLPWPVCLGCGQIIPHLVTVVPKEGDNSAEDVVTSLYFCFTCKPWENMKGWMNPTEPSADTVLFRFKREDGVPPSSIPPEGILNRADKSELAPFYSWPYHDDLLAYSGKDVLLGWPSDRDSVGDPPPALKAPALAIVEQGRRMGWDKERSPFLKLYEFRRRTLQKAYILEDNLESQARMGGFPYRLQLRNKHFCSECRLEQDLLVQVGTNEELNINFGGDGGGWAFLYQCPVHPDNIRFLLDLY